ncbi:MUSK [Branchiostoma lanceolatum]|uniref:MUSK protein n=1 Tax=Branchiostoma lanceolatum TaxID=7740 RepID=A0A8J9Z8R2_BRALA|nr:MUSK [Branchiostoma lanceolatum]
MAVKSLTLTLKLLYLEYAVTVAWHVTRPIPVLEHDHVTLNCAVEGQTWDEQQVDWYYNSLSHIYRYETQERQIGYGRWETRARADAPFQLTIHNISVIDDGYYSCDVGYPSRDVRTIRSAVNVADGPHVTVEVKEGRNLTITCTVNANPPPSYVRLTKGKTLKREDTNIGKMLNGEQDDVNIVEYTKIDVGRSDAGTYQFIAANSVDRTIIFIPLEYHCDSSGECGLVRQGKIIPTTEPDSDSSESTALSATPEC